MHGKRLLILLAAAVLLTSVACESARSTLRPSASLIEIDFTPPPSRTARPSATEPTEPTAQPSFVEIPVGWDDEFCAVYANVVDAHELVIDVERALAEENLRDARGLARDLQDVTADSTALLTELPTWEAASDATLEVATLTDLASRAAAEYVAYFNEEARSLRRARGLRQEALGRAPAANDELAELWELGIDCGDLPLELEIP